MTICLVCLIGLPGAGKSTLAKKVSKNFSGETIIIEFDLFVTFDNWKEQRKNVKEKVKNLIPNLKQDVKNVIILDDNFYYRSMRYEYYLIAREQGLSFCQIYLNTPLEDCYFNNCNRDNNVPDDIIFKMNNLLEPPSDPWELLSITFTETSCISDALNLIEKSFLNPIIFMKKEKQSQPQSEVHLADIALRKIIGTAISPSLSAKELSNKKRLILNDIKSGNITLPNASPGIDHISLYTEHLKHYLL